jgi:hypothetical protein
MQVSRWDNFLVVSVMLFVLVTGTSFVLDKDDFSQQAAISGSLPIVAENILTDFTPYIPPKKLSNPPSVINAVYVTGYSAGAKSYLNYLSGIFSTTEVNSVVVDVKGSNGYVSYNSGAPDVAKYGTYNGAVKDIDELVNFFHDRNVYVIGRIAVFEDPVYSKARPELAIYDKVKTSEQAQLVLWQDNNSLSWLDPSSKEVWDYNISLAKDALYHGFDEINFDYIRFPTDGKAESMGFPLYDGKTKKSQVIHNFFKYLRENLAGEKISADLFGQTTTNKDDMGIGQLLENAFENFDYISPMIYPSHYIDGFLGYNNPAEHPYEIIKYSLETAQSRENIYLDKLVTKATGDSLKEITTPPSSVEIKLPEIYLAKLRPWLQDFDMGADYNTDMVKLEIKATKDALTDKYNGYMLWNPSNIYTKEALLKPN